MTPSVEAPRSILRAESVGSILRPPYLKEAQAKHQKGEISLLELKRAEDRAVREAIILQEKAGLDVINDGEMRRQTFFDQLGMALNGLGFQDTGGVATFHGGDSADDIELAMPMVIGDKISRKRMITLEEFV